MERSCYIYSISFEGVNDKYYGSTVSPSTRKNNHFNLLKKNKHHCKGLQNVYNDVESNPEYLVIAKCPDAYRNKLEQWFIKTQPNLNTDQYVKYVGNLGLKKVAKYNLNGELIETYVGLREAERINGCSILECCKERDNKCGGYQWRYYEDEPIEKIEPYARHFSKKVNAYTAGGIYIGTFDSARQAANKFGILKKEVLLNCNNKAKYSKNWQFKYYDGDISDICLINNSKKKSVIQMNLEGVVVKKYDSIKQASEECNVLHSGILRCSQGKIKQSGGFKWRIVK